MAKDETQAGMRPVLEQPNYFPDLHASLSVYIRDWIVPRLPEHYKVSVEQGLSLSGPAGTSKRYQPDVRTDQVESPSEAYVTPTVIDPPSFTVDIPNLPQRFLAIRDEDRRLITTIEILSPANKTGDGYEDFRRKQAQLSEQGVHLVEIDLLTRGKRRWPDERVAQADYVLTVQRGSDEIASVWAVSRGQALPTIPVPLRAPDADLPLPVEHLLREYLAKSGLARHISEIRRDKSG